MVMSPLTPANKNLALKRFFFLLSIALLVIAVDQGTKMLVMESLNLYDTREIIPGLFNLTYLHNSGAAFGFMSGVTGGWKHWFFVGVAVVALGFIMVLYAQHCLERFMYTIGLGLIAGGAVGNVIDRVRFGSVVDFLDVYVGTRHWPAFNVADSAICVGVGLFLLANLLGAKERA
jgi:signal peptidase II